VPFIAVGPETRSAWTFLVGWNGPSFPGFIGDNQQRLFFFYHFLLIYHGFRTHF
jgi:hypothetical protein